MLYTLGASTVGVGSRQMTMAFRHLSRVSEPAARSHNGGMQQCAPLRLIWEFDGGRAASLIGRTDAVVPIVPIIPSSSLL
jgi:hypothetical protein